MSSTGDGDLLVGIDLGTTVCKCVVVDADLRVQGSASRRIPLAARPGGEIEQDAKLWWESSREAIAEALRQPGVRADRVRGLSVSSQGISFVPVDAFCEPLGPAISWMDMRAVAQMDTIRDRLGERDIFARTGKRCSAAYTLPKLLWLMEHEPETYRAAAKILMPLDFLLARLTGEFVTDHSMASGTMFYDIGERAWSAWILESFGIEPGKLPKLRSSGTPVGKLLAGVAGELGLPESTVVSVGGQDQKVAALGAGIDMARTTVSLGTAMAITRQCARPVLDPLMRIPCFSGLSEGRWVIEGSSDCCSVLDWMKKTFFPELGYDDLNLLAERSEGEPNPVTVFPFFSGAGSPHYAARARGFIHGLDFSTDRGQLVRGFYEGMACLIRSNLEVMEELSGAIGELRIFGGGSRSELWCRIIADACGKPVSALATSEAASIGAAILAGLGCRTFADGAQAAGKLETGKTFEPRAAFSRRYREKYEDYCAIRDRNLRD